MPLMVCRIAMPSLVLITNHELGYEELPCSVLCDSKVCHSSPYDMKTPSHVW